MRTSSEPAVTSPSIAATLTSPRVRTFIVAVASVIAAPFRALDGAGFVGGDPHEVGQPGDLEDLPVVVAQAPGADLDPLRPRPRQQPHDEGDAGAVDEVRAGEAQRHDAGAAACGLRP